VTVVSHSVVVNGVEILDCRCPLLPTVTFFYLKVCQLCGYLLGESSQAMGAAPNVRAVCVMSVVVVHCLVDSLTTDCNCLVDSLTTGVTARHCSLVNG